MSHATATPNEYIQLFTALFHLFSYTFFFFMSSSSVREKENLKMHWLYLLWVCSTQVCLTMRFWVFPIFKELPTFYPIYSIFQEFYCFFPLFHFPSFLEYNMKTVNAPCWTRFNLIFLINSNSFKYMHQQQFTLDKHCFRLWHSSATTFQISKCLNSFCIYELTLNPFNQ